jgi:hypothetical protein
MATFFAYLALLARHPLLIGEALVIVAVLFGVGRTFGLPLLFWHELRWRQAIAGAASTMAAAEILFVIYLADSSYREPTLDFGQVLATGGVVWAGIVLGAYAYRWLLRTQRYSQSASVVTPRFLKVGHLAQHAGRTDRYVRADFRTVGGSENLVSADPAMWPFAAGCCVGGGVVVAIARLSESVGPLPDFVVPGIFPTTLHLVAAVLFVLMSVAFRMAPIRTPAAQLCLLLGLGGAAYGWLEYATQSPGIALLIIAALFVISGLQPYRLQIAALADLYARPAAYPPPHSRHGQAHSPLLPFNAGWPAQGPRPLIVVCASGGGIRAAAWTAAVLERLDAHPAFRRSVRLVTGASGGMVGAAFWVARLHAQGRSQGVFEAVSRDALSPLAHRLIARDIPSAFLPIVNRENRGEALERAWSDASNGEMDAMLGELYQREQRGELPSLVFTPMIVEDGRRLIISNLDLEDITTSRVHYIDGAGLNRASLSAFHAESILPGVLGRIPLRTAARMAASFAYVSPASVLPTKPGRHVVDAGYYDNYGLSLACEWLRRCVTQQADWLQRNVSRVLLLQIRDNVSELSVQAASNAPRTRDRSRFGWLGDAASRGIEWAKAPIDGVLSAHESVMLFRNDAALGAATQLYEAAFGSGFLKTTVFEFKGEASLSWYLTQAEIGGLRQQADSPGIRGKIADVAAWLG